jgi:hypothetical protein
MEYARIADRIVPMSVIYEYVDHQLRSKTRLKALGYSGYEYERARLHNNIFLAAGFTDTRWGTARKTAAWFATMGYRDTSMRNDPDIGYDAELVKFNSELDYYVGRMLDREKGYR